MEKLVSEDTPHVHPWVLWRVISLFVLVDQAQDPSFNFCLPQSLGNGVALLDVEGGPRSALLWTLLRGSTTEPHPDILPPIRLVLVVMKIFQLNSHSITWDGRSVSGKRP